MAGGNASVGHPKPLTHSLTHSHKEVETRRRRFWQQYNNPNNDMTTKATGTTSKTQTDKQRKHKQAYKLRRNERKNDRLTESKSACVPVKV